MTQGKRTFLPWLTTLALIVAMPAMADGVKRIMHADGTVEFTNVKGNSQKRASTKNEVVFRYKDDNGVVAFSGTRPSNTDVDVIHFYCYACDPNSRVNWHTTPLYRKPFSDEIKTAATEFGVDPALVRAVIHAESAFNPAALSPKGAQGLMQLMPATAMELGVKNAMMATDNIRGGVNYLALMLKRFNGDISLAAAAYNAGPGAVSKYNGIPPYAETKAYVKRVGILRDRYATR
ncbi:MAG: lytic transglycosylase [Alteromonadaceae bacterium]|uniref:lytic transglycosylase domain-containing protein n=1 Tax=unclassified Marinobacter TaxID=83889 RepID=UPI000C5031D3|nr:lytic transglycosylase domain-containing protein [Marinobacter sp. BGYM27]MAA65622.1 lytic transglycosylase [Alteromonadaceae bacterium]MBH86191.1 lytic transglycosylase [Alteromonadaceae bacterium]MDG5499562.1 lytic transglycosylase domain-containing protein [Marinobacter sp. BGYM27]|tara:strand:+ start:808 stop:1509 length:702 start_codon:yes stop_codon:yes gene_type:complete